MEVTVVAWFIFSVEQRCMHYARFTPNSRGPKNGQIRGYSGVGRQGFMFLLCYSSEGHKLLLYTHNDLDLLTIEMDKLHDRF